MMSQFVNWSDCREGCAVVDRTALSSQMTVICSNVESLTEALPSVMEMSETFSGTGLLSVDAGVRVTDVSVMLPDETRMNCEDGRDCVAVLRAKRMWLIVTKEPETVKSGAVDVSH